MSALVGIIGIGTPQRERYRTEVHQRMMERARERGVEIPPMTGPRGGAGGAGRPGR